MRTKQRITLSIDKDVLQRIKSTEENISKIVEAYLRRRGLWSSGYDVAFTRPPLQITKKELYAYTDIMKLKGITDLHKRWIERCLLKYLKNKERGIEYFLELEKRCSRAYYKKQMLIIIKFLKYYNIDYKIVLPRNPVYSPKRVTKKDVDDLIERFPYDAKIRCLILLGFCSGLRATELYRLTPRDININSRTVYVRHSKTGKGRVSFFPSNVGDLLKPLLDENKPLIFGDMHKKFRDSNIKCKDLRKAFSQEWTLKHGDLQIKKVIMGHRQDIDLRHYNFIDEETLKREYERVFS